MVSVLWVNRQICSNILNMLLKYAELGGKCACSMFHVWNYVTKRITMFHNFIILKSEHMLRNYNYTVAKSEWGRFPVKSALWPLCIYFSENVENLGRWESMQVQLSERGWTFLLTIKKPMQLIWKPCFTTAWGKQGPTAVNTPVVYYLFIYLL
jgi:hypothetical protein